MHQSEIALRLESSPFFGPVTGEARRALAEAATLRRYAPGENLFAPGDDPRALYLVAEGVLEISRRKLSGGDPEAVAYLGPGATVGESKVIVGSPHSSRAVFPQGGTTLQWPRAAILDRLLGSSDFALKYLENLARRLEGTLAALGNHPGVRLDGQLDHFDLGTILRMVVDSGIAGTVQIRDAADEVFGTIAIRDFSVAGASRGRLHGVAAFLEIMDALPRQGRFSFSTHLDPDDVNERHQLNALLLESARISDELSRFLRDYGGAGELAAGSRPLRWSGSGDVALRKRIWRDVSARPATWRDLADRLPYSRGQVAAAVGEMLRGGTLTVVEDGTGTRR